MQPIIKWPGGKESELKYILPMAPRRFNNYYEPFVGGGAVYTSISAHKYFINDKSDELIGIYKVLSDDSNILMCKLLREIDSNWRHISEMVVNNQDYFRCIFIDYRNGTLSSHQLKNSLFDFILTHTGEFNGMFMIECNCDIENYIVEIKKNLLRKINRMVAIEHDRGLLPHNDIIDNIETAFKSAYYMHYRHIYNNIDRYNLPQYHKVAIYIFIRNYAYSGMFRYNSNGDFNVPYGGIAYNKKSLSNKIKLYESFVLSNLVKNTIVCNMDFFDFFNKYPPGVDDFVFLDPPYDTEFSTYSNNEFNRYDQERLADYLINRCRAKWMLVIKNNSYILNLYHGKGLDIQTYNKSYKVSFMNRNDKNAEHLMIRSYL